MRVKRILALQTVCILSILVISGMPEVTALGEIPTDLNSGPYVNNLVYTVITNPEQRILAMQDGDIELDTSFVGPDYLDMLQADPDIDIFSAMRNGYGHITINCRDAPLNESVLRRAFAFAYDKVAVTTDIMGVGFSQEHDSVVPYPNGWCIEDEFDWHYYTNQSALGNQILDDSGLFPIDGGTGYRTYKGTAFDIEIEYSSSSPEIGGGVAQIGVDALHNLYIDADTRASDFNDYISRLDGHENYDMVFYSVNFYSNDVDWLAYEYWSDYADVAYQNPSNFANSSYDIWRDQLLNGTTYEDVYEAAAAMQEILQYNVPRLVVYENTYKQAYRIDEYTGHVEDLGRYIAGPWTTRNIRKLDGTSGGSVPIAIADEPDTFNIFLTFSESSAAILSNLYSSLYKLGPDLQPWPDLAESMLIETHSDNAAVPTGHTRYTIDIIQNATWTDGVPLTANDVAFSYIYAYESAAYGNPAGVGLGDLVTAYAPTPYRVVVEFNTESYWHFSNFAYDYIIPEHIFNDDTGIGYDGWSTWNPVFSADPHVTSGPFVFSAFETGDWYQLTKNPLFYYPAPNAAPVITAADDTTYVFGSTGNVIVWEASDDNPLTYVVIKDLNITPVASGFWDGSDITVNIDGLEIGLYEYTLGVTDYSGNLAMDTVTVTVVNVTTTTDTSSTTTTSSTEGGTPLDWDTLTILISVGSIAVILVVVVLFYKTKQT